MLTLSRITVFKREKVSNILRSSIYKADKVSNAISSTIIIWTRYQTQQALKTSHKCQGRHIKLKCQQQQKIMSNHNFYLYIKHID